MHDNLLTCDLGTGCAPDAEYVSPGKDVVNVHCQVQQNKDSYFVNIDLATDPMNLSGGGTIGPTGGTFSLGESDQQQQVNNGVTMYDDSCKIDIVPNFGIVQNGAIWARFKCDHFVPVGSMLGSACQGEGAFLFENCGVTSSN